MNFDPHQLAALFAAASFAAGLNVYATVGTLGILARVDLVRLPPSLHVIATWPVIAAALALFILEFFADKIPVFDLVWNALHTFIRVPVAALLAWQASANFSPEMKIASAILGGAIALVAHTGKTALRTAVTPSPEPVSNIALSAGEDVVAIGLTWFATQHPYAAAAIAAVLLTILVLMARWIARALVRLYRRTSGSHAHTVA